MWVKGNVAATDEFMAANYVDHPDLPSLPPGREGEAVVGEDPEGVGG